MPATAGRVRMPASNRVHSSAALQTHGIWQSAIGYDPYAPTNTGSDKGSAHHGEDSAAAAAENAYSSFQGLLALARATGSVSNDARGACKKCGRVGHLTFQCRNFLSAKDPSAAEKEKDDDALRAAATAAFERIRKSNGLKDESSEEEEEEEEEKESDSSDSDVDPEIEKIIAARFGKKSKKSTGDKRAEDSKEDKVSHQHRGRSKKRSGRKRSKESDESDSGKEDDKRKKRRHRGFDDDVDEDKHGHRHSRSRRDEKRRKSHKKRHESDDYDDDDSEDESDRRHHHKRRHYQRNDSESDSDDSDRTNSRKKSHKHRDRHGKKRTTTTSECGAENDGSETVRGRKGRK